jgi:hypothetical protein
LTRASSSPRPGPVNGVDGQPVLVGLGYHHGKQMV